MTLLTKEKEDAVDEIHQILRPLIPLYTNEQIIRYTGMTHNFIYTRLGKFGRRGITYNTPLDKHKSTFNRISELFLLTQRKNDSRTKSSRVKKKSRPSGNIPKLTGDAAQAYYSEIHKNNKFLAVGKLM